MKIAIVGTGANGAGIGADMVQAGLDVTFIEQWPEHVEAMRAGGLRVEMPDESTTTQVDAYHLCEVATLRDPFDLVFVLVKAYDTRWACELIKPLLNANSLVVGLQNGMSIDDMSEVVGEERTVGAVIEVAGNMFDPGIVVRQTPPSGSWFTVGALSPTVHDRLDRVVSALGHSGDVEIADDIRSAKWMKLVANAAELVPSAILNLPLAEAVEVPGMREFMDRNGTEAIEACVASGNRPVPIFGLSDVTGEPSQYAVALFDIVLDKFSLPDTRTTVLQDWLKGRRSEVEEVNGLVVREAEKAGIDASANRRTVEVARRIETRELKPDPANVELLVG